MASVNEASVIKKLQNVNNSQDSIQTVSLWIIHHKAHNEKIVNLWFKVLKKAKMTHRLTLFYLCNDVVQNCKRKHAIMYKDAFKEVLREAVLLVRDPGIRSNVERIFNIWDQRNVYDSEFIEELTAVLNHSKVQATANSKLLAEFKPQAAIETMLQFKQFSDMLEVKRKKLKNIRVDSSSVEAIKQLKDRTHGKEFCGQFEESCNQLDEYVKNLEKEMADRNSLVELLEQAELFYDAQYDEVKLVANAYKNFGSRVNNQKKRLEEKKATLLDSPSPLPSPSADAPSPGNTPPLEETCQDNTEAVDMDMSDSDEEKTDSKASGVSRRDSTSTTKCIPQPIPSITHIEMRASNKKYLLGEDHSPKSMDSFPSPVGTPEGLQLSPKGSNQGATPSQASEQADKNPSVEKEPGNSKFLLALKKVIAPKAESMYTASKKNPAPAAASSATPQMHVASKKNPSWVPQVESDPEPEPEIEEKIGNDKSKKSPAAYEPDMPSDKAGDDMDIDSGASTPLRDEGGATPVMDEQPEANAKANPIEFLTQLITQTKKTTKSSEGSSSSFMQSLSVLTNAMKKETSREKERESTPTMEPEPQAQPANSWAQWKAQQHQPEPPVQAPPKPPPFLTSQAPKSNMDYTPHYPGQGPPPVPPGRSFRPHNGQPTHGPPAGNLPPVPQGVPPPTQHVSSASAAQYHPTNPSNTGHAIPAGPSYREGHQEVVRSSNLTTVVDPSAEPVKPMSGATIPTLGTQPVPQPPPFGVPPVRPPGQPPARRRTSSSGTIEEEQQEFINKLKRRTSSSSPNSGPGGNTFSSNINTIPVVHHGQDMSGGDGHRTAGEPPSPTGSHRTPPSQEHSSFHNQPQHIQPLDRSNSQDRDYFKQGHGMPPVDDRDSYYPRREPYFDHGSHARPSNQYSGHSMGNHYSGGYNQGPYHRGSYRPPLPPQPGMWSGYPPPRY